MSDIQPNFEPQTIKVTLGINSTVRWVNTDKTLLSIASDHKYDGLELYLEEQKEISAKLNVVPQQDEVGPLYSEIKATTLEIGELEQELQRIENL